MACITPIHIQREGDWHAFPCGKCPDCLARRTSGWSFRLMQEDRRSSSSLFVTLTYDTRYVPITNNGFMSLRKSDVQDFMKRLRKRCYNKVKYYVAGEYGSKRMRPHYHMLLFNANPAAVVGAWSLDGHPLGDCHFGSVSAASVGYTLKYMCKPKTIPIHVRDDRIPEFSLMSKDSAATI